MIAGLAHPITQTGLQTLTPERSLHNQGCRYTHTFRTIGVWHGACFRRVNVCCVVLIYFRTLLQRPWVRLGGEREPPSGSGQDSSLDGPGFRGHRLWLPSPVCIISLTPVLYLYFFVFPK